jgi:superfamily II DNA/RNA helicase
MPQNTLHILTKEEAFSLEQIGIQKLLPMQEESLEAHAKHHNVLLLSPTGTGKTLAFALAALRKISGAKKMPSTMVLAPSRELALQIESVFRSLRIGRKICCVYGGHSTRDERNSLVESPAIIIGTPGRLAYHIRNSNIDPAAIRHIVVDEFDKALDLGFEAEMMEIFCSLTSLHYRTFTSATRLEAFPDFCKFGSHIEIDKLVPGISANLALHKVSAQGTDKLAALGRLLNALQGTRSLVFCNHRDAAERIGMLLAESDMPCSIFHGGMEQADREKALIKFRHGSSQVLVATDLASRGLDIPMLDNIIHYQIPVSEDVYIHRNGRTARMSAQGAAFFVLADEDYIPAFAGSGVNEFAYPPLAEDAKPKWETLFIGQGKKDKISKGDIAGFLIKQAGISSDAVGNIDVLDRCSFVAVHKEYAAAAVKAAKSAKLKNRKVQISVSK